MPSNSPPGSLEFANLAPPRDGDLQLLLAEWITCQPDNVASRRTRERLAAQCVGVIDVPRDYPLDAGAERKKLCFRLGLQ